MRKTAFTAIELLTVLGVMVVLVGMATPTVMTALRQSAVNDAAQAIITVASKARQLARIQATPEADARYGVELVSDSLTGRISATVTFGTGTVPLPYIPRSTPWYTYDGYMAAAPITDRDGQPHVFARTQLARTMTLRVDGSPLSTPVRWQYQPRSGSVLSMSGLNSTVGTASSRICTSLEVGTLDGRMRRAIAVYEPGLIAVESL